MTKEQIEKKIKELVEKKVHNIIKKDKSFDGATIQIKYKNKVYDYKG